MNRAELRSFVDESEVIFDTPSKVDEANTKAKVIRPFLETIGWNVQHDAELEFTLQLGSSQHSVDYALRVDGVLDLFVEAKRAYKELTERHRQQLHTYMITENVDWGLLTNGRQYEFCRRRVNEDDEVVVDTFGSVELSEITDERELVLAFSKEAIKEGRARRVAERRQGIETAYERLQERESAIVEGVTDALVDHLGNVVKKEAEVAAHEAVENLGTRLRKQTTDGRSTDEPDLFWARVRDETGISKQNTIVEFPDDRSATDCFVDFVDLLFADGLIDESDVPVESGRKRYLLNYRPVDQVGDEMQSPRKVDSEVCVETNYSRDKIRQHILELTEMARSSAGEEG